MKPNLIYRKLTLLSNRLRGLAFVMLHYGFAYRQLSIGKNVQAWGSIGLDNGVQIGANSKLYKKVYLEANVRVGDNVEIRCNRGNSVRIGANSTVNRGSLIFGTVHISRDCLIGPQCSIIGSNHVFDDVSLPINQQGLTSKGINIRSNVWLGANVTVIDGVTIGENSIIGAASVVTKNIPPDVIAVGNPARVIKRR